MIANKLKKKSKFFDYYGEACKKVIKATSIIVIYVAIVVGISFMTLKLPEDILYRIDIGTVFALFMCFVIRRLIWLNRFFYLPTTHEELQSLDIHSADEYADFITDFFLYYCLSHKAISAVQRTIRDEFGADNYCLDETSYFGFILLVSMASYLLSYIVINFYFACCLPSSTLSELSNFYWHVPSFGIAALGYIISPLILKCCKVSRAWCSQK